MTTARSNDCPPASPARAERPVHSQAASEIDNTAAAGGSWQDILPRLAILLLAVLWIYSPVCNPTLQADWLWDDDVLLTANPTV